MPDPTIDTMTINLFTPLQVGPYRLRNRMVMAPLTRSRAGDGNVPHALNALYYAQRASAGLIISEATQVVPEGQGYIATPGIHSDAQIAGWRRVTEAVHLSGGLIYLQLWHVGRISHTDFQPGGKAPVAPSAVAAHGKTFTANGFVDLSMPRALELAELPDVVAGYRTGAANAMAAGFDGVEVHGANGYLLDQFLRTKTNRRTDAYGGSIENRMRLLLEVVDAVAAEVGADRVGVRISPENAFNDIDDSDPVALFMAVAKALSGKGLGYLHVIEGNLAARPGDPPSTFDYAALKAAFGGVYMPNNGFDRARADEAIANGRADLVAFGKLFLANPDLVTRFLFDAPLNAPDDKTFYGGDHHGYTDYPLLADVAG
jgi:N-ethylmaleimide reductase